jgi:hypothetical protein
MAIDFSFSSLTGAAAAARAVKIDLTQIKGAATTAVAKARQAVDHTVGQVQAAVETDGATGAAQGAVYRATIAGSGFLSAAKEKVTATPFAAQVVATAGNARQAVDRTVGQVQAAVEKDGATGAAQDAARAATAKVLGIARQGATAGGGFLTAVTGKVSATPLAAQAAAATTTVRGAVERTVGQVKGEVEQQGGAVEIANQTGHAATATVLQTVQKARGFLGAAVAMANAVKAGAQQAVEEQAALGRPSVPALTAPTSTSQP